MKFALLLVVAAVFYSCSPKNLSYNRSSNDLYAKTERTANPSLTSEHTTSIIEGVKNHTLDGTNFAFIGILYFQDSPIHRDRIIHWIENCGGEILYEDLRFGFLDAKLSWENLEKLISDESQMDNDTRSVFRLELEYNGLASNPTTPEQENSTFTGPVHSAGYGSNLDKFKLKVKEGLGISPEGAGTTVAVFDGGLDLSWANVFGNRLKDYIVTDELYWKTPTKNLEEFKSEGNSTNGIENPLELEGLKFLTISEKEFPSANGPYDINGSKNIDSFTVATYKRNGKNIARFQIIKNGKFGDEIVDIKEAVANNESGIVNMFTGKQLPLSEKRLTTSAAAIKFREVKGVVQVAIVGTAESGDHGIANLHMVGGKFSDEKSIGIYNGVATETNFIYIDSFARAKGRYGQSWIFLSRGMIEAANRDVDVIDLDIYTPGTRSGEDILSALACRIRANSNAITIAAAHNFGPLPNTIQSLAQSPCVLGIGASHSYGADKYGFYKPVLDQIGTETSDTFLKTASYSGRGFGLNGTLKPDIITPAYGRTPYGKTMMAFNGTSGATPTTAGLIALLKQVAKFKGKDLTFSQIKYLLQNSSERRVGKDIRDGYGFVNMEKALDLLLTNLPGPIFIKGNQQISYPSIDSVPNSKKIQLGIGPELGATNNVTKMNFSIEYQGASKGSELNWLSFKSFDDGQTDETLEAELPILGEQAKIEIVFDKHTIQRLPDGDHVALIIGKRVDTQFQEFLLPVSFTKTTKFSAKKISTTPLYIEDGELHYLNGNIGDTFLIRRGFRCDGKYLDGNSDLSFTAPLALLINNQKDSDYTHASSVMNTYMSELWSDMPITVEAKNSVTTVAIYRTGSPACIGPIVGNLDIKRVGFEIDTSDYMTNNSFKKMVTLKPTGFYPLFGNNDATNTGWKFSSGDAMTSFKTTAQGSFTLPQGKEWRNIKFYSNTKSQLQGVAVLTKENQLVGVIKNENRSYSSGVTATKTEFDFNDISSTTAVTFIPANSKQSYTIELNKKTAANIQLTGSFGPSFGRVVVESPNDTDSESLTFISTLSKEWKYGIVVPILIIQQPTSSDLSNLGVNGEELIMWKHLLAFPEKEFKQN